MNRENLFEKNVQYWMLTCLKEAKALPTLECPHVTLCQTGNGEWNLRREVSGVVEHYHSPQGAMEEAREWFSSLDLYNVEVLFVYGVGLGYYYQALKTWLHENGKRAVIFLEDDLEVIHRLFGTELGKEILRDQQVRLQFFYKNPSKAEEKRGLSLIPIFYFMHDISFSALKFYAEKYSDYLPKLGNELEYIKNCKAFYLMEYLSYGETFFQNFYRNILELPTSYLGDELFGKFKGVPAVVCGGGPSIEKSLPLLGELGDKAIIFAGGSSINTINCMGLLPHFGVSIDPNWNQYARLFMNQAYEVPFFYRNRIFPEALSTIHGDHLYVAGTGGYEIAEYFEEKLGIEKDRISEGNSVVNFSLALAEALGCDPIILVGVDLAYTDNRSYGAGICPHPILDVNKDVSTRGPHEEVITKNDINGKPVGTLWKWVTESMWIAQFAATNPKLRVINSTEGGIGFLGIQNIPFAEAVKDMITESFDLKACIHGEIQNARMPPTVTKENILDLMKKLKESLERCRELCGSLKKEFGKVFKEIKETEQIPEHVITDQALSNLKLLNGEVAFENVLGPFNKSFTTLFGQAFQEVADVPSEGHSGLVQLNLKRAYLNKRKYEFLKAVCNSSLEYLQDALEVERLTKMVMDAFSDSIEEARKKSRAQAAGSAIGIEKYEFSESKFSIIDEELQISVEETSVSSPIQEFDTFEDYYLAGKKGKKQGCYRLNYPSGSLKMEQYYHDGNLHGPAAFFSEEGTLLSQSWFVNGLREGKTRLYYHDGGLYSIERFRGGRREGKQEYFYSDQKVKSIMTYHHGLLEGPVMLFHHDGFKKRELYFAKGKRNGPEIVWNFGGIKEFEGQYKNDVPVGVFRSWHALGNLSREITYNQEGQVVSVKGWDLDGTLLPSETFAKISYFDMVRDETQTLTNSFDNIFKEVEAITGNISTMKQEEAAAGKTPIPDLSGDMLELKEEFEKLKKLNLDLGVETDAVSEGTANLLWNTPNTRRLIGKQLQEASQRMAEDIKSIEEAIKLAVDLLSKQKKPEEQSPGKENQGDITPP